MKTTMVAVVLAIGSFGALACDEKKNDAADAGSAMPSATAPTANQAAAASMAITTASAPATPTVSPSAMAGPTDTAEVSVQDPVKEPTKTALVNAGGTVNLYLPKWAGSSWAVKTADKALPKPKEETIPGFAGPTTPAAKFAWKLEKLKAGSYKVEMTNTVKDDKTTPPKSFTLTIEVK